MRACDCFLSWELINLLSGWEFGGEEEAGGWYDDRRRIARTTLMAGVKSPSRRCC